MSARARRPRQDRIAFSISKGGFTALGVVALAGGALLFGGGYLLGKRGVSEIQEQRVVLAKRAPSAPTRAPAPPPSAPVPPPPAPEAEPPPPEEKPKAARPTGRGERRRGRKPKAALVIREDGPENRLGIQLGAFPEEGEAMAFVHAHETALADLPIHVLETKLPKRGTWYRVRVGAFATKAEAESARKALPTDLASSSMVVKYR